MLSLQGLDTDDLDMENDTPSESQLGDLAGNALLGPALQHGAFIG